MNLKRVNKAVFDRLRASGLGESRISFGQVPDFPNVDPAGGPVIVVGMSGAAAQDDSGGAMIQISYSIVIVCNRNDLDDGPDLLLNTRDRIFGDGSPGNPTYGLHNHNLVVTSAADTVALSLLYDGEDTIGTTDPDNLIAHEMRFRVLVRSV